MNLPIYPMLIQAFFANIELDEVHSTVITSVQGKKIILDPRTLARILNIPYGGSIATHGKQWITDPFSVSQQIKAVLDDPSATTTNKPSAHSIPVHHRIMHHIISYNFIPRDGHRDLVSFLDMFLLTHLISHVPFNLPHLMMWQIIEAYRKRISLPFGLVFTRIFRHFGIGVEGAEVRKLREPHDFYTEITFRRMRLKLHHGGYVRQEDVAEGDASDDEEEEDSEEMSWSSGDEEAQPPDTAGPSSVPSPAPPAAPASFSEGRSSSAAVDSDIRDEIRDLRQDLTELTHRSDTLHQDFIALSSRVDIQHQEIMDYLRSHLP